MLLLSVKAGPIVLVAGGNDPSLLVCVPIGKIVGEGGCYHTAVVISLLSIDERSLTTSLEFFALWSWKSSTNLRFQLLFPWNIYLGRPGQVLSVCNGKQACIDFGVRGSTVRV